MDVLLSVDLGTTACKSAAFAVDGQRLGSATEEYPLSTPHPGWAEQDPEDWWSVTVRTLRRSLKASDASPARVRAISISSQGISFVPVDREGTPLGSAISWLDMRAQDQAAMVSERIGDQRLFGLTGKRPSAAYVLPKLLWLRENAPALFRRMDKLLLAHDWLLYRLCGAQTTDYSMAGGTMLLDLNRLVWSEELLSAFDLSASSLPSLAWAGSVAGTLSNKAAAELGLPQGIPVVVGGQDQKCAALGAAIEPGVATISLGTATAITCLTPTAALDPLSRIPLFPFVRPGWWTLEGVVGTTGAALKWARATLWPEVDYPALDALAEASPPGSNGARFYPHLAGATSPIWDGGARGTLTGLSLSTGKGDIVRSILEGVCYQIRANLEAMAPLASVERLVVFGGGARSRLWCELLAQVTALPVRSLALVDVANWGACVLAGIGSGLVAEGRPPEGPAAQGSDHNPHAALCETYNELYQSYLARGG